MKTILRVLHSHFRRAALAALLSGALLTAGCDVTAPDESPWQDVSTFSWPKAVGTSMLYKVEGEKGIDTNEVVTRPGVIEFGGRPMLMLNKTSRATGKSDPLPVRLHFLPTRDTLITERGEFKATYALVAPLEKGRQWISAYADANPDSATHKATIIERYSLWKLEGKVYENVVAVKYEFVKPDAGKPRMEWIRFFAQGIGEILTVTNEYPKSNFPSQATPDVKERVSLIQPAR